MTVGTSVGGDLPRVARLRIVALLAACWLLLSSGAARGAEGPTVAGWARTPEDGGVLSIRVTAASPGGWEGLHLVAATLLVPGGSEQVSFDIDNNLLSVGDKRIVAGTGAEASGSYLRVSGSQVVVTTGGARIEFTVRARLLRPLPSDASVRLEAEDDLGHRASVTRPVAVVGAEGSSWTWSTVVGTAVAALLAGVFLGGAFATRRHPRGVSVYAAVQRRLEEERAPGGGTR